MRRKVALKRQEKKAAGLFLVLFMTFLMVFGLMTQNVNAMTTFADIGTIDDYAANLGANSSTRYAGRIWTDKTVYTGDATFTGEIGSVTVNNDSDFLVAYSALATSQSITGRSQVPIDVVFVIDNSNSMDSSVGGGSRQTRLEATVDAVNSSIEMIMDSNENSRVAVVIYGLEAEVLMPLSHYDKTGNEDYVSYDSQYVDGGLFGSSGYKTTFTSLSGNSIVMNPGDRGTNTHMGVDTGMDILAGATDIETDGITHMPAMVLLSDGAATASGEGDWWDPSGQSGAGTSTANSYALKVAMNAQYMKQKVDSNYGLGENTGYSCKIYTIGMGIEQLNGNDYRRAQMALDPGAHLNDNNNVAETIKEAWYQYSGSSWNNTPRLDGYTFEHPSSGDIDTLAYNDGYYSAENAEDVTEVFEDITSAIIASAPQAPTQIEGNDPMHSGYLTYTDPIGSYMEVKELKALIYGGQYFEQDSMQQISEDTVKYTFEGTITSPVYGELDASNIEITVKTDENKEQTLNVRIPAAAIPLRVNEVQLDSEGNVQSHTNNGAYPARIVYSVGVRDDVDLSTYEGISDEYIEANTTADGKLNFYSNMYTGNSENMSTGETVTVGNAKVTFVAASSNPFFYVQENTPLYTDESCLHPATGSIDPQATYYFKINYYEGLEKTAAVVARSGGSMNEADISATGDGGQLEIQAGQPRLGYLDDFVKNKSQNSTSTAQSYFFPKYDGKTDEGDQFSIYLGNNGLLQVDAPKSLTIAKNVTADQDLTAPDEDFSFELIISDRASDTANAVLHKTDGTTEEKVLNFDDTGKATFTLKAGQSLEILNIGINTEYTVNETDIPEGFTADENTHTGTVSSDDENNVITFTNNYSVTDIDVNGTELGISGTKYITGDRQFEEGDSFTFTIRASQVTPNAPLPAESSVTVNPESGNSAEFTFGSSVFTFDVPGQYRYIIAEDDPTADGQGLPGISYDSTIYRLIINIADNGDGTLSVSSKELAKYDGSNWTDIADGNIEFTNIYSISSETLTLSGRKVLEGMTMSTDPEEQFSFIIEAGGSRTSGSDDEFSYDATQPMPQETEVKNLTTGNIMFGAMTFGQETTGKEYKYIIREKQPTEDGSYNGTPLSGAVKNQEGKWVYKGITYDNTEKVIIVTVDAGDNGQGQHAVLLTVEGDTGFIFTNTYEASGTIELSGIKNITGREFKNGDIFTFNVEAVGNAPVPEKEKVTIEPSSGNQAEVDFGTVTFDHAGTYTYKITEESGSIGGLTYDTAEKTVTVIVSDNGDGTMDMDVSYSTGDELTWTNRYSAVFTDSTSINLEGSKILRGDSLEAGEFYFVIEPQGGAPMGSGETVIPAGAGSVQPDGSYKGRINLLNDIKYTEAGTYQYLIREQIPASGRTGMTYDEAVYMVTVEVTDDLNGNLIAADPVIEKQQEGGTFEPVQEIVFTNVYAPLSTSVTPYELTKQLTGVRAEPLNAGEFSFEISVTEADPEDGIILPAQTEISNQADGTIQFGNITFTKAGTYKVQVKEIVPEEKAPGMTYDTHVITTTFHVTDENGQLAAYRTGTSGSTTFTNTYAADGTLTGADNLAVIKELEGRDWLDSDQFTFTLSAGDEATLQAITDEDVILPDNAENIVINKDTAGHSAAFGDITFKKPGEYTFVISEIKGEIPGITYDDETAVIKVTATDNGEGTLAIESDVVSNDLNFTNIYKSEEITLTGDTAISVTKQLNGKILENGMFDFEFAVEALDGSDLSGVTMPEMTVASNDDEGKVTFGDVTFTKAGTYKFTVTEVVPEDGQEIAGVTYDDNVYTVTYKVTDNFDSGKLEARIETETGSKTFVNVYGAQGSLSGQTYLTVEKVLDGRDWRDSDSFTFVLKADETDENTVQAVQEKDVVLPDNAGGITIDASMANEDFKASFGDITVNKAGTYKFVIEEVIPEDKADNMAYDEHKVKVTVTAVDRDGEGILDVTASLEGSRTFTNVYTPDPSTLWVRGTKVFTGRDVTEQDTFTFDIAKAEDTPEDTPMPSEDSQSVTISGDDFSENSGVQSAWIPLGTITYDEEGTYRYVITERQGTTGGVTYDSGRIIMTVTVTYDSAEGRLDKAVTYEKIGGVEPGTEFKFTNIYDAAPADVLTGFEAQKTVTPSEGNSYTMKGGEFSFTMTPAAANPQADPVQKAVKVSNGADGKVIFNDGLVYTEPGTYTYTISEDPDGVGGITYDDTVYTLTVEVTDDGSGKLKAALDITKDGQTADAVIFRNGYDPEETGIVIKGMKYLERKALEENMFSFMIEAADGAPVPENNVVYNTASGEFAFGVITYYKPGTYEYKVREVKGNKTGYTYDDTVYDVIVTVTDKDGTLAAEVSKNGDQLEFRNSYAPIPASLDGKIGGIKELDGRDLKEGEFEFVLKDGDEIISVSRNDKDGNFTFEGISISRPGTYNYTISENSNGIGGVEYDRSVYDVKITAVDNNGVIETTVSYSKGTETFDNALFLNRYEPAATTIQLGALKQLSGRDLKASEFRFVLRDEEGNVISEAGNDADGSVRFDGITYDSAGIYRYTISEIKGDISGVRYDDTVYNVTVTVKDSGLGYLEAQVDAEGRDIVFNNVYDGSNMPKTGDEAPLREMTGLMAIMTAVFMMLAAARRKVQ